MLWRSSFVDFSIMIGKSCINSEPHFSLSSSFCPSLPISLSLSLSLSTRNISDTSTWTLTRAEQELKQQRQNSTYHRQKGHSKNRAQQKALARARKFYTHTPAIQVHVSARRIRKVDIVGVCVKQAFELLGREKGLSGKRKVCFPPRV